MYNVFYSSQYMVIEAVNNFTKLKKEARTLTQSYYLCKNNQALFRMTNGIKIIMM